jgi:hypothetical protein
MSDLPRHHVPVFVFAIALKPKSASSDRQQVESNLRRTILSARAADPDASMIVAYHDEPDLGGMDEGVVALSVPLSEPVGAVQDLVAPYRALRILRDEFAAPDIPGALSGRLRFGRVAPGAAKAQTQKRLSGRTKAVWS